jgi:hypothetical protein
MEILVCLFTFLSIDRLSYLSTEASTSSLCKAAFLQAGIEWYMKGSRVFKAANVEDELMSLRSLVLTGFSKMVGTMVVVRMVGTTWLQFAGYMLHLVGRDIFLNQRCFVASMLRCTMYYDDL